MAGRLLTETCAASFRLRIALYIDMIQVHTWRPLNLTCPIYHVIRSALIVLEQIDLSRWTFKPVPILAAGTCQRARSAETTTSGVLAGRLASNAVEFRGLNWQGNEPPAVLIYGLD